MLQDAVTKLPKEEAEYHIKRCIDSGLWVPGAGEDNKESANDAEAPAAEAAGSGSANTAGMEEKS